MKKTPMNIALFGPSGSGKTTVAEYLVSTHGFVMCGSGSACREVCRLLFNSESKTLLNKVTDALKEIDERVWLRAALADIVPSRSIVFDSMRFSVDYEYLRNKGFTMWRIEALLDVRVARLQSRGQEFHPELDSVHPAEIELDLYEADYIIVNSHVSIKRLYQMVEKGLAADVG